MENQTAIVPLSTNRAIELMKIGPEFRVDSRIVAKEMGLQHESFIKVLRKYQNRLEKLGIFRFEIGKIDGKGRPETYIMLNRNQAMFALTLSRNTEQVVDFKFDLIEAFDIVASPPARKKTPIIPAAERRFLPAGDKDQYIFHVVDLLGVATGRDVQRYTHWYSGNEARRRMAELAEQGDLVEQWTGRTYRYTRSRKQLAG